MLCVGPEPRYRETPGKHIFLFLIELVGVRACDHTHVHNTLDSVLHLNFTFTLSEALEPDPEKPDPDVCIYKNLTH